MKQSLICGDVFNALKTIPSESVDLVLTSPPYWGLRAYGTNPQVFGGDPNCDHEFEEGVIPAGGGKHSASALKGSTQSGKDEHQPRLYGVCRKCGAWLGELGGEPTLEQYLDNLMRWVREVYRVLKPTGSFVLNLGGCYYGSWGGGYDRKGMGAQENQPYGALGLKVPERSAQFYKPKQFLDLSAFAYQQIISETSFVCRNRCTWCKPNVPSPIRSRLKQSTESVDWFVKDADEYFFDPKPWMKPNCMVKRKPQKKGYHFVRTINGELNTNAIVQKYDAQAETIAHSWRVVPVGEKQKGFELLGRDKPKQLHVAPFPEALIKPWIASLCPPDGTVLDPFVGSGTTLKVCRDLGLSGIGVDLDGEALDYAKKRLNWGAGLNCEYEETVV